MSADELRELIREMSALALDLGQHLELSARFLNRRRRLPALRKASEMAYRLYLYPYEGQRITIDGNRTAVFDSKGLHVERPAGIHADARPPIHPTGASGSAAAGS